jgi:hypothetical protein
LAHDQGQRCAICVEQEPLVSRRRLIGLGLLAFANPFNAIRHVRVLRPRIFLHFGTDRLPTASSSIPVGAFYGLAVFGTAALTAGALLGSGEALAAARGLGRGQVLAAHALFWLGAGLVFSAVLVVWAVLESNEEDVPFPSLPPTDDCMPCRLFIPFYAGCVAGNRWLVFLAGVTLLFLGAAGCVLGGSKPAERVVALSTKIGTPAAALLQRLGRQLTAEGRQEAGVALLMLGSFSLFVFVLEGFNPMSVAMAPGWDQTGTIPALATPEGGDAASCPMYSVWVEGQGQCMCDDKFICEGCHDEYPHDEGFVMEKVERNLACVPVRPPLLSNCCLSFLVRTVRSRANLMRTFSVSLGRQECVFNQGIVNYSTLKCECAAGFEATATTTGWGATACAPTAPCSRIENDCSTHASCAHLGPGEHSCVCNRLHW